MTTYNNGPGNVPRLPRVVVDTLINTAGVSRLAYDDKDQNAQVHNLVHDTCEELLARLPAGVTAAAHDVLAERRRQVKAEGYEPDHDDEHKNEEIAAYAAYYAMPPGVREWPAAETGYAETFGEAIVPDGWTPKPPGDRRRELVKAGALILAEIERLDRAAQAKGEARECTSCDWKGTTDRMLGSIGPLCLDCGDTTERSAEQKSGEA